MPPPYNETLLISKFGPPNYKFNTQTASPPGPTPFHYVLFDSTVAGVDQRTVDQYTAYIDRVIASGWVRGAHWMCIFSSPYYLVILTDDWNPSAPPLL